jgi:FMN phosphatase YigB (HAD superfamily)
VTFDFWSTLVDGAATPERMADRVARLHRAIVGAGFACSPEQLSRAYQVITERFEAPGRDWFEDAGPPGRWAALAYELGIPDGLVAFEVVERAYADITLNPPPPAMPHVQAAVAAAHAAGYRLGVICNTGMAGGSVLREVLKRHGLFDYFDVTVFSNEFGVLKPHPSIFLHTLGELGAIAPNQALHVGDVEALDVDGARRAGMYAALYAPSDTQAGQVRTDADFVVRDWRAFASQLAAFRPPVTPG